MTLDTAAVNETLIHLADTLVDDFDLLDYLDVLLSRSISLLEAESGGVMLADDHGQLQVLASSDERVRLMELYELQRQDGPCLDAHRLGQQVAETDLQSSQRWPDFRPYALDAGLRAAFAFPLRLRGQGIGALNVFRSQPGAIAPEYLAVAQTLAHMAAIGILQQRAVREAVSLAKDLQVALNSRIVLEQAKGIVAARAHVEMGEAYQLLRWHARNHNLTIGSVATSVVHQQLPVEELAPRTSR